MEIFISSLGFLVHVPFKHEILQKFNFSFCSYVVVVDVVVVVSCLIVFFG